MTWEIAITVAAIGLLALLHLAFAPPAAPPVAEGPPAAAEGAAWGRWLALAAVAAAAIALAALIVPAIFGGSSSSTSATHSTTTTIPSTTTTQPTTTTRPTTTRPTTTTTTTRQTTTSTTRPSTTSTTTGVTTTPGPPPKGSAVLVRGTVTGTGELAVVQNRLGGSVTAGRVSPGVYRIVLSDLSAASRRKSVVRVSAGPRTTAVGGWSADGHLVVLVSDKQTGAPAARPFSFVVVGPKQQAALPRTT